MAHSDSLIFLTSITWIFVLFLFTYFFFVLFFLPTLYKKFRLRVLIRGTIFLRSLIASRASLIAPIFAAEALRSLSNLVVISLKKITFYFNGSRALALVNEKREPVTALMAVEKRVLNARFSCLFTDGGVIFVKCRTSVRH